jgi:hypothetical protein
MTTTNPLTYSGYIRSIAALAVIPTEIDAASGQYKFSEPNLAIVTPQMLSYAELRIQRDLDLVAGQTQVPYTLTSGASLMVVPNEDMIIVQDISLKGVDSKKTTVLTPTTREFLMLVYPDATVTGVPKYFAPYVGNVAPDSALAVTYRIGPAADQGYEATVLGSARMQSLAQFAASAPNANNVTYVSTYHPDLLLMASMVFLSAYQRNFSSSGSDPQMPINYETQYQTLLKSSMMEELRKRFRMVPGAAEAAAPPAPPPGGG